jgi:hypothetical protein
MLLDSVPLINELGGKVMLEYEETLKDIEESLGIIHDIKHDIL